MEATRIRWRRGVMMLLWAVLTVPAAADYEAGLDASDVGDYATAFNEFTRAAAEGDLRAANSLGELYERGDGVERDPVRATEWYRRAAGSGNREAQYNLAGMYRSGDGVTPDAALSMQWYRRAADQRLAIAQFFVAKNYEHGQGAEQDPAEAWAWYSLAAVSGDSGSAANRDRIARSLSEEQRRRAAILLRDHALELALPPATLRALGVTPPAGGASVAAVTGDEAARDIVSAIQQGLAELGYDIGTIDGVAGPHTRHALSEFARSVGMEGDPPIGPLLLEQLHAARAARSVAAQELDAASATSPAVDEAEQEGAGAAPVPDSNPAPVAAIPVRDALRQRLLALGYGPLDSETAERDALAAFSRDAGLDADAISTDALLMRMDMLLPAVARAPQGDALVRDVQVELAGLGHDPGPADGLMGSRTRAALAAFANAADFPRLPDVTPVLLARLRVQTDTVAATAWATDDPPPVALLDAVSSPTSAAASPAPVDMPGVETQAASEPPPPSGAALVRSVQSRLEELGYEPGPVDGLAGSRTRRAARNFRADRDLPGDTQVDALLSRQLDAVQRASAPPVSVQAALMPTMSALAPDTAGMSGPTFMAGAAPADPPVREAQQALLLRGYRPGATDGQAGPQTREAIAAFQHDEGLNASGELDPPTLARLRTPSSPPDVSVALLRDVQSALADRGFDPGPVDGAMGPRTRAAIAAFRRDQGLPENGALDAALLRRLDLKQGN